MTTLKFNFGIFPFAPLTFLLLLLFIVLPDAFHLRPFKELPLSSHPKYFL